MVVLTSPKMAEAQHIMPRRRTTLGSGGSYSSPSPSSANNSATKKLVVRRRSTSRRSLGGLSTSGNCSISRQEGRLSVGFRQHHRHRRHLRLQGLEEHIEETLGASYSEVELDEEERKKKMAENDGSSHPACCGDGMQSSGGKTKVEMLLDKTFDALKLTQFSRYVSEKPIFTLISAAMLVVSGFIYFCMNAQEHPLATRFADTCLCAVYTILGVPSLIGVAKKLAAFIVDIHVLTILAVFGTIVIGSPVEGALLLVLFQTAAMIEERLTDAAKGDLAQLLKGAPKVAAVVEVSANDKSPKYDTEISMRVEEVEVGEYVLVKAGEVVPLDGVVVYGRSDITSENITGESLPYIKGPGDTIPAGARSVDGTIVVQTTRNSEESTPMRILKLTKAAQEKKSGISLLLNKWMNLYSKIVLLGTLVVSVALPPLSGISMLGPSGSLYRAAAFLTAAAPCALVMAPLAYITAISVIARKGIIVKGGKVIDTLARCDTIALDKTGTLTMGELECTGIVRVSNSSNSNNSNSSSSSGGSSSNGNGNGDGDVSLARMNPSEDTETLSLALAVSQGSTHPISEAVKKCALEARAQNGFKIQDFRMIPGYGVEALAKRENDTVSYEVQFGSVDFISKFVTDTSLDEVEKIAKGDARDKVIAVLHAKRQGNPSGTTSLFTFSDKIKSNSALAIDDLQNSGGSNNLQVMMLTGDHEGNAMNVANKLGIKEVYAGLLPEEKVQYVEEMRTKASKNGFVAMVGDGINDAPALASADVGIAFASSTDAAAASVADAIVLKEGGEHMSSLPYIFRVARKTRKIVNQNIAIAMVSIIGTCLPSLAGWVPLWMSVSLHEGSTVLVALNSLRCLLPDNKSLGKLFLKAAAAALVLSIFAVPGFYVKYLSPKITLSVAGVILALKSASSGLFAGSLHSLAGPDHLAALAPLAMGRSSMAAGFLGGLWGFGHCVGQIVFGIVFVLLKSRLNFNMEMIEQFAGGAIGVTLMAIGLVGYREAKSFAFDQMKGEGRPKDKILSKFSLATFGTGFLHGLSPDAIFPILPAITLSSKACAFAFILAFLVGTIGSMASYTAFIGVGSTALAQKRPNITRNISIGSSFLAIALGSVLLLSSILGVDIMPSHGH